jgi:predicted membrane-bound mannosyltransferase
MACYLSFLALMAYIHTTDSYLKVLLLGVQHSTPQQVEGAFIIEQHFSASIALCSHDSVYSNSLFLVV